MNFSFLVPLPRSMIHQPNWSPKHFGRIVQQQMRAMRYLSAKLKEAPILITIISVTKVPGLLDLS